VRIITGKGLHSAQGQSVLRELAEKRLSELRKNNVVLSFKWEKGKGALVVYLA
jgi:DNA-nicking Smr family endonuclease